MTNSGMLRLTTHAQDMLESRNIELDWVRRTVNEPAKAGVDARDAALTRSFRESPEAGGRMLRVVHRRDGADIVIITAHFDRGAKR